ncbi:hypothetical protein JXQ70_18850 [bacterium]|nr:hypothetical protein [bacterium]
MTATGDDLQPQKADQGRSNPDVSILELLESDFRQKADTVYRETVILNQHITEDDFAKKIQIDALLKEIGDPFFYGSIVTSIGKTYYFLPIRIKNEAYLLKEVSPDDAKFRLRYHRTSIDIEIRSFSDWRIVKQGEPLGQSRYIGMNKKCHASGKNEKVCFIVIDFKKRTPST